MLAFFFHNAEATLSSRAGRHYTTLVKNTSFFAGTLNPLILLLQNAFASGPAERKMEIVFQNCFSC
jgi:hypothetical protein